MSEVEKTAFRVHGSWAVVDYIPDEVREELSQATKFRPADVFFSPAYQNTKWDGYIRLMRQNRFPRGLLSRVLNVWKAAGLKYEITAQTDATQYGAEMESEFVGELRPYQVDAVDAATTYGSGILRAPTGAGKTMVACAIAHVLARGTLVVVPTIDLLYQFRDMAACNLKGIPIGQLGDGVIDPQMFTVATVRTMAKVLGVAYESYEYAEVNDEDETDPDAAALADWLRTIGTLIIDEAQILGAQSVFEVAMALPVAHKFGVSASPWRDDGCDLMIEAAVGPLFHRITTKKLLEGKYLVPPIIRVINLDHVHPADLSGGELNYSTVYRQAIAQNEARNEEIAKITNDLVRRGYQTLVLVKHIKHGRALAKLISESIFVWGNTDGEIRHQVYEAMRHEDVRVLVASTVADMGLDIPSLGALVLAGGGKSSTRHLQRLGRICRPFAEKTHGLVVDFDDSAAHPKWFGDHLRRRLKIAKAEWEDVAIYDF